MAAAGGARALQWSRSSPARRVSLTWPDAFHSTHLAHPLTCSPNHSTQYQQLPISVASRVHISSPNQTSAAATLRFPVRAVARRGPASPVLPFIWRSLLPRIRAGNADWTVGCCIRLSLLKMAVSAFTLAGACRARGVKSMLPWDRPSQGPDACLSWSTRCGLSLDVSRAV